MSLYAIGDFHLSFTVNKPMDVFDKRWKNHVVKIEKYWKRKVTENDTVVITGDHSWGRDLAECQADLDFIMALPGRKILLRGNHDMFWDAKKTENLNEMFRGKLEFLQNNFYTYEDYALVGTKGYCYEGKDSYEHFLNIRERELGRLRCSFEAAKAAGYINAGTIEFLLEPSGTFYFMEMNTRIQVEHPITEWITGIDLIKEQIRIAAGEKLTFSQKDIRINGHAIEVRINAEKPEEDFRPCPGTITGLHLPGGKGIRIDSAIYSGYKIPPFYDSMIAKISVWAKTREEAIRKAQSALGEVIIEGVDTNVDYQYGILEEPDYRDGNVDINYIENHF